MDRTYAKHLSHGFVISSAINPKTLLRGSHVFFSNLSTKGPASSAKILLLLPLAKQAYLVRVLQMLAGLWIYLQYAIDAGIMNLEAADIFKLQAIETVLALSQIQVGVDKDASYAERFVKVLQSALSMGSCHLAKQGRGYPKYHTAAGWKMTGADRSWKIDGQGVKVGWMNEKHVFIDITAAQKVAK